MRAIYIGIFVILVGACIFFKFPEKKAGFNLPMHPLTSKIAKAELLKLFQGLEIKTLIDIPCGKTHWVQEMKPFVQKYIGVDDDAIIIEENREKYGTGTLTFQQLDCTRDLLPQADLIFCHDAFNDCAPDEILAALLLFKKSRAKFFLATLYSDTPKNPKRMKGPPKPINWQLEPYHFPKPLLLINDPILENKHYALWKMEDMP